LFTRSDLRRYAEHEAGDAVGAMDRPPCGGDLATAVAGEDYVRVERREQALRFPPAAALRNAVTVASCSAEPTLTRGQRQLATGGNDRFQLSLNASALHLAVALGGAAGTVQHWH
jgi:hypothetical protein